MRRSNPGFLCGLWIASRSLSSGAHSHDPLARNEGAARRPSAYRAALQLVRRSAIAFDVGVGVELPRLLEALLIGENVLVVRLVGEFPVARGGTEREAVELGAAGFENAKCCVGA